MNLVRSRISFRSSHSSDRETCRPGSTATLPGFLEPSHKYFGVDCRDMLNLAQSVEHASPRRPPLKYLILAFLSLTSFGAIAETIVCEGQVDFYGEMQKFKVSITGQGIGQAITKSHVDEIKVEGASLEQPNVLTEAQDYWDGHATGMITASGFTMTYDHIFGCIRNVVITTDFRGDIKNMGMTVGHVARSEAIALCKNENALCSR